MKNYLEPTAKSPVREMASPAVWVRSSVSEIVMGSGIKTCVLVVHSPYGFSLLSVVCSYLCVFFLRLFVSSLLILGILYTFCNLLFVLGDISSQSVTCVP